jgi:hypothetical protein
MESRVKETNLEGISVARSKIEATKVDRQFKLTIMFEIRISIIPTITTQVENAHRQEDHDVRRAYCNKLRHKYMPVAEGLLLPDRL